MFSNMCTTFETSIKEAESPKPLAGEKFNLCEGSCLETQKN